MAILSNFGLVYVKRAKHIKPEKKYPMENLKGKKTGWRLKRERETGGVSRETTGRDLFITVESFEAGG